MSTASPVIASARYLIEGLQLTVLLSLLTGLQQSDSGEVKIGASLQMVTLDQRRESLAPTFRLNLARDRQARNRKDAGQATRKFFRHSPSL